MTLAILFSLKSLEWLQNGVPTNFFNQKSIPSIEPRAVYLNVNVTYFWRCLQEHNEGKFVSDTSGNPGVFTWLSSTMAQDGDTSAEVFLSSSSPL